MIPLKCWLVISRVGFASKVGVHRLGPQKGRRRLLDHYHCSGYSG